MKVCAIQCRKCQDIIYSRARHDMRWCSCGTIAIDGGNEFSYCKITGRAEDMIFQMDFEVPATSAELYDDWNSGRDKFGLIKVGVGELSDGGGY